MVADEDGGVVDVERKGELDGACRHLSDVRTKRSAEPSNPEQSRPITSPAFPGVPLNHLFVANGFDEFGHTQDDECKSTFGTIFHQQL